MNGRRLSRHDRVLLEAWAAELADVQDPADLSGGLDLDEVTTALARVAISRTAVEAAPDLAAVLVEALRANDAEYASLVGAVEGEIHPDDTEVAAAARHLAVLLARARDRGHWAPWRAPVLVWVAGTLRVDAAELRAVAAVVSALDDTAGAEPAALARVLDARDVPALLWVLSGLAAVAGGGDTAWLRGLEPDAAGGRGGECT